MKQLLLAALLLFSIKTFSQNTTDTLNNASIIKLSKSKLPENVILKKINSSYCSFDVSVDALVKLKQNGVNDSVINAMMNQPLNTTAVTLPTTAATAPAQNLAFNESGIYFPKDAGYAILDPAFVTVINPGPALYAYMYKFKIDGPEANYQIENKRPEFYFVFDTVKKSLNDPSTKTPVQSDYFYIDPLFNTVDYDYKKRTYQAISPNDFRLIKLELDKNNGTRKFATEVIRLRNDLEITIDKKYIVGFKYEKLSSTTFKIKFEKDLPPGEYCFFYSGNNKIADCSQRNGQNTMKAFDFSIK
jgi:hypothetical protein